MTDPLLRTYEVFPTKGDSERDFLSYMVLLVLLADFRPHTGVWSDVEIENKASETTFGQPTSWEYTIQLFTQNCHSCRYNGLQTGNFV